MYLSRQQVREVDQVAEKQFGVPGVILMENAGRGCAELLQHLGVNGKVIICCGKGNNGGDGFVIARHLDNHDIPVQILLFADPESPSGDAAINYQIVRSSGIPIESFPSAPNIPVMKDHLKDAEWCVDALFGTGLQGAIRDPFPEVIETINSSGCNILAVDIPSGLDCDTGETPGVCVRASHTATFVALKLGFQNPHALDWLGQVHVVSIGVPKACIPSDTSA